MSQKESLGIFLDLYQFSQELRDEKHYSTLTGQRLSLLAVYNSLAKE